MKRRLLTLIAFLFCASTSGLQQADNRLELLVFKTRTCDPCRQWTAAYNNPFTGLKVNINRAYRMRDAIVVQENLGLARKYSVERVPTFVLVDGNGREVHRVLGFTSSAALLNELRAIPRVPSTRTQPQQPPVDDSRAKRLEEANEFLQQK
ncbi:MAG: thioredoxin family protein, partial [Fuerstiella sp.]